MSAVRVLESRLLVRRRGTMPRKATVHLAGTLVVMLKLAVCGTQAEPLDSMRRICMLQVNSSRDQIHALPMFKTAEDRLRFQLEAFEVRTGNTTFIKSVELSDNNPQ